MPTNPFWLSFAVTNYMKRLALHLHDRKDVSHGEACLIFQLTEHAWQIILLKLWACLIFQLTDNQLLMHTDLEELGSSSSSSMQQHQICSSSYPGIAQRWLAVLCAPGSGKIWGLTEKLLQFCNSADDHSSRFQRWLGLWVMAISCFRCTLTGMSKHRHARDMNVKPCSKCCKTIDQGSKMNSTTYIYLTPEISDRQGLSWVQWPCL